MANSLSYDWHVFTIHALTERVAKGNPAFNKNGVCNRPLIHAIANCMATTLLAFFHHPGPRWNWLKTVPSVGLAYFLVGSEELLSRSHRFRIWEQPGYDVHSLLSQNCLQHLQPKPPELGWQYPDFSFVSRAWSYPGPLSRQHHCQGLSQTCETLAFAQTLSQSLYLWSSDARARGRGKVVTKAAKLPILPHDQTTGTTT